MKKYLAVAALALLTSHVPAQRGPIAPLRNVPSDINPKIDPSQCGDFQGHFGPLDFRSIDPRDRRNVESNHLDMELRTFLSGQMQGRNKSGTGWVSGGFNYTLKAIPNHPVSLLVMEQFGRKMQSETPPGSEYPLECWYLRAFMIAPDDPVVRAMYGIYLSHRGRDAEALANLKIADEATSGLASLQFHIGQAHFGLKQYKLAQVNAMRAKRRGFALDALERSLRAAGQWDESLRLPDEPSSAAEGSSSASAPTSAVGSAPAASSSGERVAPPL